MAKIAKIVSGIVLVILISLVIFVNALDVNKYKSDIIQATEQATGRKLTIGGNMQFSLLLSPTIKVQDVSFSNASWGRKPNMLSMHKLELQVALLPLLSGHIKINQLILIDPDILLQTNKHGVGNWQLASAKTKQKSEKTTSSNLNISFNRVQIQNAKITYINGASGQTTHLNIDRIETKSTGFDAPLSVMAKAAYNDIPILVSGNLGSITQWQSNQKFPLDLKLMLGDAKLSLKGDISTPKTQPKLNLTLAGSIDSLDSLNKLVHGKLPKLGPVNLTTKLTSAQNSYSLNNLTLQINKTALSGSIHANLATKKPTITANLNTKLLDLTSFSDDEKTPKISNKEHNQRLFSSAPLPLAALKAVNANVALNADQIKTKKLTLSKVKMSATLKDGVLTIKPLSSVIAGGRLNGAINLNASTKVARLAVDVTIKGLEPAQIGDLSKHIVNAKTNVDINIKSSGNSVRQIMAGLNGKMLVHSGKGTLKVSGANLIGTDILTMLNPTIKSGKDTKMLCAVVNFNVKDGIAIADKGIALMTDQMNVVGSGTIDLKTEKLDIGLKPHAREGLGVNVGQLADFVRVGGTLADPSPTTDIKSALTTGLKVQTAVATGGLSLLAQGLFDRITADDNPCDTALGIKTTKKKTSSTKASGQTSKPAKDSGSITDKLKSLF